MIRPTLANLIAGGLLWSGLSFEALGQNPLSVAPPEKDNSAAAELNSFELAPGYQANLFADETDGIANPVCMSWDAAGRLWVLCTWVYPQAVPTDPPDDKLLILEDTDADGRADKTTVFARGLNMPTGFAIGDGGAYVGEGNDLLHLADTDGDDEADVPPRVAHRIRHRRHPPEHQLLHLEPGRRVVVLSGSALLLARRDAVGHQPA